MKPVRVGLICDLREEGWHSMDLISDMLMKTLPAVAASTVVATELCPPMIQRWTRLPIVGGAARAELGDRLTGRFWDYPRWLVRRADDFDVFHIVDHSYAHLVRVLPPERTIVTCNDVDALQAALSSGHSLLHPSRLLARRVLDGLSRAGHIACISCATRTDLLATGRINPERVSVVHLGVHPSCSPLPDARWDVEIDRRLGPAGVEILHVGSTVPRKRIDVLLEMLRALRPGVPGVRLLRVGGQLTPAQAAIAQRLGVSDAVVEMPFLERPLLAALYRRASVVVLPSDREGFGLPVVEAMACGTPVVASAIPALKEIGGDAATFCPPGDVQCWAEAVAGLLRERQTDPARWEARRRASVGASARFDWKKYAAEMARRYCEPTVATRTEAS